MSNSQQQLARGWQLHQQGRLAEAEQIYRQVLTECPQDPNAWCYLGIALHDQHRYPQAVDCYRQALTWKPDFPIALNNLGNSLRYIHECEEAEQCFLKAIELKPDYLNAHKNRGTLHVWTGNLQKGLECYQRALQINPQEAELHRNLGVIYLLQGRYSEGWREYRWRWQVGDLHRPVKHLAVWEGSSLEGKSILLTAEQGLGDTLHFARFAQVLRAQGARTLIYCQPQLLALLQAAPDLGPVYPNNLPLQQSFHFQCSLLDAADRTAASEETLPRQVPYLRPSDGLRAYWGQRLAPSPQRLRVGIAWQGNPDHQADAFRSIPLQRFETLSEVPGVELWSLQGGKGTEQIAGWRGAAPLHEFGPLDQSSGAFMDTAAIMQHLDLVITSDTSIAHLAGGLGVPVWIALGYVPDWRWLLDREDSPWYPSARLIRQSSMGDWQGVFARLAVDLRQAAEAKRALPPE